MIYLNSDAVEFGRFPNGEIYLPFGKLKVSEKNEIKWIYESNEDFVKLGILSSYLSDMNCKASLYISYLPYSRMDRPNGHYVVSIDYISSLINSLSFEKVIIREPHSAVCMEKINNSICDMWCEDSYADILEDFDISSVYYPDKGAMKRYNTEGCKTKKAFGFKERDFKTGEILGLKIKGGVGKSVLIVDDLCSRGGTFVNAAKLLKEQGAKSIYLLVAYCEENVFTGELFNHIDRIFVPRDSMISEHQRITKIGE